MNKLFIGIDPGSTGAIGMLLPLGAVQVYDLDDPELIGRMQQIAAEVWEHPVIALIERQWTRPGFRPVDNLLVSYGRWMGRLDALGLPYGEITPQQWQAVMFKSTQKIYKTVKVKKPKPGKPKSKKVLDSKATSLKLARQLFPQVADRLNRKKDSDRADALLIAEYCRRNW